ncbi:MAG: 4Fe-4S dicluster domain-containing protein [Thermodesulfobacteriota bacterium]|nr:4Fe-4S dicluster domain-containing protein [Thermodesulfobacteriota bacterium]
METRRSFLKKGGLVVMAAAGLSGEDKAEAVGPHKKWAMIIDLNRCTGCQSCVIACKGRNRTAPGEFNTRILTKEEGHYPDSRVIFTPVQCNQCENPPCVAACPAGAIFKLACGIVVTDWDKCQGLGNCVVTCPYDARFQDSRYGNKADKCDFCLARLEKGLEPACVEACPSRARLFGDINAPSGEFAEYLKVAQLIVRKPELNTRPRVTYVGSRHGNGGVL